MEFSSITRKGKRAQNEDFIFPASSFIQQNANLFIVCDGVGGSDNGAIASKSVCTSIVEFFEEFVQAKPSSQKDIDKAIKYAERKLKEKIVSDPELRRMATTLALIHIHTLGVTVAHIGDSRIYHIRDGIILFQTIDHSLINELVASGHIKGVDIAKHPSRNVITRAIKGDEDYSKAEVKVINSGKNGDFFLMCSDGLLEGITEEFIREKFTHKNSVETLIELIDTTCLEKSTDNYSAIIIKL